ncbi:MAG: DNA repair protein RecO [Actinobacteria bacterium]|nr:DNA repair protein RecO [Actinomycetota bacterium]
MFIHKGRNLDIVNQVEIISPFLKIKADLDKITYGLAVLDLVDKVSQESEKNPNLFVLLISALEALEQLDKNIELFYAAFQLKLMAVSGYLPRFSDCVNCRDKLDDLENLKFSFEGGGILCFNCGTADSFAYNISKDALCVLVELARASRDKIVKIQVSDETLKEISFLTGRYINYHLGSRIKSMEYVEKIKG